jgi:hypothetical protein
MSKEKLITTINREIEDLNEQIDWKVIKGMPYKREAKRHKLLVSMLQDVRRHTAQAARGGSIFSFLF